MLSYNIVILILNYKCFSFMLHFLFSSQFLDSEGHDLRTSFEHSFSDLKHLQVPLCSQESVTVLFPSKLYCVVSFSLKKKTGTPSSPILKTNIEIQLMVFPQLINSSRKTLFLKCIKSLFVSAYSPSLVYFYFSIKLVSYSHLFFYNSLKYYVKHFSSLA